jgi:hypothetical protein
VPQYSYLLYVASTSSNITKTSPPPPPTPPPAPAPQNRIRRRRWSSPHRTKKEMTAATKKKRTTRKRHYGSSSSSSKNNVSHTHPLQPQFIRLVIQYFKTYITCVGGFGPRIETLHINILDWFDSSIGPINNYGRTKD